MYQKLVPIIAIFLLFTSCRDEKTDSRVKQVKGDTEALSFYDEGLLPKDFEACKSGNCPKIRVNYLKFREDREAARAMNQYNEKILTKIFNNTEEDTNAENIKAAIEELRKGDRVTSQSAEDTYNSLDKYANNASSLERIGLSSG